MTQLTCVMYHYVRPAVDSAFPRLKALELDAFLGQLDHLQANYDMITPADLTAALSGRARLPARPCILTFDDGYSDHYEHVFPALKARGLSGLFFAPKSSLIDRQMLEVNRIQFTLANHPDPDTLAGDLDRLLADSGRADPAALRAAHFKPNRYDSAGVSYTKRLLQHALPSDLRSTLTKALFEQHVSADEASFVEDLYFTVDQAREMRAAGMEFGGHGDLHLWHDQADRVALEGEVAGSVAALDAVGAPVKGGFYCYPFGGENDAVRTVIDAAGFAAGFTVVPLPWDAEGDPLRICRLDTNDLPQQAGGAS